MEKIKVFKTIDSENEMIVTLKIWKIKKEKIQLLKKGKKIYLKDKNGQCEISGNEDKIIKHIDFRIKKIYNHESSSGNTNVFQECGFKKIWPYSKNYKSKGNKI